MLNDLLQSKNAPGALVLLLVGVLIAVVLPAVMPVFPGWFAGFVGLLIGTVAGLVLMAAGLVVREWAILTLGRFFTVDVRVHAGQTVVERGPYKWVRHPAYTGLLVFLVGFGLAVTNWSSLLVLALVPTIGLLVRIRSEERALLAGLGDDYRRFAATRLRLFPGIW